ncbi:hypothetical protein NL676_032035 [Syzygium grande]|nr:hypothetical protein NL676_032035 [Syzygium grande]
MLKPVMEAKEVAMDMPGRGSSPRWPMNMTEITCTLYCCMLTPISGLDRLACRFNSSIMITRCSSLGTEPAEGFCRHRHRRNHHHA